MRCIITQKWNLISPEISPLLPQGNEPEPVTFLLCVFCINLVVICFVLFCFFKNCFFLSLLEVGFTPPGIPTEGKSLSCYCHMELWGTWQPANVAGPTASLAVNHLCASDCGFLQNKGLSHYRCRTDKNGLFSFNYKTQINLSKVLVGSML